MRNWLRKFDETMLGMLFQDQYLSPSEIVRIAATEKQRRCGTACTVDAATTTMPPETGAEASTSESAANATHLIGMR